MFNNQKKVKFLILVFEMDLSLGEQITYLLGNQVGLIFVLVIQKKVFKIFFFVNFLVFNNVFGNLLFINLGFF